MGVDTHGFVLNTTRERIFEFIQRAFDRNARYEQTNISEDYSTVHFNFLSEKRMIHLHRTVIDVKADMKRWKTDDPLETDSGVHIDEGLPDKSKGVYMSLGMWGSSVKIMKMLAMYFDGYVDDNDSDAEYYYRVKRNLRKLIKELWSGRSVQ
jgi:hypothetical protein